MRRGGLGRGLLVVVVGCLAGCGDGGGGSEGSDGSAGSGEPSAEAVCDDGLDDDRDGAVDCADPDCVGTTSCGACVAAMSCTDVACHNGDLWCLDDCGQPHHVQQACGAAGCSAGACAAVPGVETVCDDGLDDDEDGAIDCADSDCSAASPCAGCTSSDDCASVECRAGDVWCFDACGRADHVREACGGAGCSGGQCQGSGPACGDGTCDAGESCASCAADCGPCPDPGTLGAYTLIEAGTFAMGSPEDELGRDPMEGPQHEVTLTRAFYMKVTEVTQAEWVALMGENYSSFEGCDDCPVETVGWYAALVYANARSKVEGLAPCYILDECQGTPGRGMFCNTVAVDAPNDNVYACEGYRLPTEAEWEYAYRAGTSTAFYNGPIAEPSCAGDANLDAIGWYCGNAGGQTHPVAQKAPNAWGLYDMAGNVWEWCWDRYTFDYYDKSPPTDPLGPDTGSDRIIRGGSWDTPAVSARAAHRRSASPNTAYFTYGFRLVRTANP